DGNGSHASTLKSPSYTKSVSWQHYRNVINVNHFRDCSAARQGKAQICALARNLMCICSK
ncbi:hypothetical protein, partial [Shigella flexneri]|uniref:hypothetical protein n=1 Tax=Shigella flexneri TaxID=623 RepID=UPI003CE7B37E